MRNSKRIRMLELRSAKDEHGKRYIDVYPTYEDGSMTLIPEWSFYPKYATAKAPFSPEQYRMLMEEAIYRGKLAGMLFHPDFLKETGNYE